MADCPWCCAACGRPLGGAVFGGVGLDVRRFSDASGPPNMILGIHGDVRRRTVRAATGRPCARPMRQSRFGVAGIRRGATASMSGAGTCVALGHDGAPGGSFAVVMADPLRETGTTRPDRRARLAGPRRGVCSSSSARAVAAPRAWDATTRGATPENAGPEFGIVQNLSHTPPVAPKRVLSWRLSNSLAIFLLRSANRHGSMDGGARDGLRRCVPVAFPRCVVTLVAGGLRCAPS